MALDRNLQLKISYGQYVHRCPLRLVLLPNLLQPRRGQFDEDLDVCAPLACQPVPLGSVELAGIRVLDVAV